MSVLKKKYKDEVKPALHKKFGYKNPMMIPGLRKVVINMGVAEVTKDKNAMQDHVNELTQLSGQAPIKTLAKKSISNFKLRDGQPIGLKVTLRGTRMFDFVYRFCNIVCPRIRDFRGFAKKGDRSGNYSLGLNEQDIFPEVDLEKVNRTQGMNITFVTTANTDEESLELLTLLGIPFIKED
ncbi:50S ribosomal protein L5 [Chlamydiales bacterium SCGC AG-110-M15]|nr:50S ribosomal protein L5 [Chlamydiales bacterium SCGC AG-110-M15]